MMTRMILWAGLAISALVGCARGVPPPTAIPTAAPTRISLVASATAPPPTATIAVVGDAIPERVASTPFPAVVMPETPAADFTLRFAYGSCTITRILDTASQTLRQTGIDGVVVTVTLELQPHELRQIYDQMRAINFWGYPDPYDTILPETMIRVMPAPHPRYEFLVQQRSQTKQLIWDAATYQPTTRETDNLRALVQLLQQLIADHPATAQLPRLVEACA
jgi:hypothetical protein